MVMVESAVTLGAAFSICFLTPPLFLGGAVRAILDLTKGISTMFEAVSRRLG